MPPKGWVAVCAAVVFAGASVWLYVDNRRLKDQLASASVDGDSQPDQAEESASDDSASPRPRAAEKQSRFGKVLRRLGKPRGERPSLDGKTEAKETRAERRLRRQQEIRAFLGRDDGETEEEYRERMVPLIKGGLEKPRERLESERERLEELAGVTDEQSEQLDSVFEDAYQEAMDLTNQAVAEGELTPYDRNWAGVLNFSGGIGAILNGVQGQIGSVLTPEQLDVFSGEGFEWGEYLGVRVPWEDLNPPPPPPGSDG